LGGEGEGKQYLQQPRLTQLEQGNFLSHLSFNLSKDEENDEKAFSSFHYFGMKCHRDLTLTVYIPYKRDSFSSFSSLVVVQEEDRSNWTEERDEVP
jgi:hypothetical protein